MFLNLLHLLVTTDLNCLIIEPNEFGFNVFDVRNDFIALQRSALCFGFSFLLQTLSSYGAFDIITERLITPQELNVCKTSEQKKAELRRSSML